MKKDVLQNYLKITIPAKSMNEALSRSVISAFISQLDPTIEELCDLKTAVSEAVTNCIVHAYRDEADEGKKLIYITADITKGGAVTIRIRDKGCGISDIEKALTPMYSGSSSEERSGMGFSIMQVFSDKLTVRSKPGKGTTVSISKHIGKAYAEN
ncbi:MAG: anti-sigma F factor [Ruminococcaceae bacterium]|nr:anti-sigma F factor [Oscillospiraceae bacterium]